MDTESKHQVLEDPKLAKLLFSDTRLAWLWLLVRLYVGWQWIWAAEHKFVDPKWMQTGESLKAFMERAIVIPDTGRGPISYDWYRSFLTMLLDGQHYVWFAKLVTFGEAAVGIALILGAFVGIAATFGAFMNWNFMMAGTASTNPMLIVLSIGIILAWKTAGWIGLDRYLLPMLGTPWSPGELFHRKQPLESSQPVAS